MKFSCSALTGILLVALLASVVFGGSGPLWAVKGRAGDVALWQMVLWDVRLPRVLVAVLVGTALSVAGGALQGLFRNPLADPSVLGVSAAAALFAQVTIFTGWAQSTKLALPVAAASGALIATFVLLRLVKAAEHGTVELLLLGGIALGQVAVALSALLVSLALRDFSISQRLLAWMLGSLDGRTWMHVLWGIGPVVSAGAWLFHRARQLDGMSLGDVTARSMGVDVTRIQREVVIASAILSGVAVAMAGIVAFVGLIVPHLVRRMGAVEHGRLLLGCSILGATLVVLADLASRLVIAPSEMQIGVITAALGAPWFALLLRARLQEVA